MKCNGYFTFEAIIGTRGAISDAVCVGSLVIIIYLQKKLTNKYAKKFGIFNKSRDHSTSIEVLKQARIVHDVKSQ